MVGVVVACAVVDGGGRHEESRRWPDLELTPDSFSLLLVALSSLLLWAMLLAEDWLELLLVVGSTGGGGCVLKLLSTCSRIENDARE